MTGEYRVIVVSDIHYASEAEKARRGYESRVSHAWPQRILVQAFRHLIWLKDPLAHNHLLDAFMDAAGDADLIVANGDYSCDSAFVGVVDEAAFESAQLALAKLRSRFGRKLVVGFGDHELGKVSLVGGVGGLRLASHHRATEELGVEGFWRRDLGNWVLLGVSSSLVALPVFEPETLAAELPSWRVLREAHLKTIRAAFMSLRPDQRVVLFCHDPTAIPYLWQDPEVRTRLPQLARTIIGHLHTPLILWKSRLLAGMPVIRSLGNSIRRMSTALNAARRWRDFRVTLCPSLSGCQLLKDGGFGVLKLSADAPLPRWQVQRLPWK